MAVNSLSGLIRVPWADENPLIEVGRRPALVLRTGSGSRFRQQRPVPIGLVRPDRRSFNFIRDSFACPNRNAAAALAYPSVIHRERRAI